MKCVSGGRRQTAGTPWDSEKTSLIIDIGTNADASMYLAGVVRSDGVIDGTLSDRSPRIQLPDAPTILNELFHSVVLFNEPVNLGSHRLVVDC